MRPLLLLSLSLSAGCTPPALDLVLDMDADRHWASGDVYRIPDDACTGPVTTPLDGTATVSVSNEYLETDILAVLVDADCEETGWLALGPGETDFSALALPAVIRILTTDDTLLSAWTGFYPLGAGTIHVQP